jgi:hypothetical protein
MRDYVSFDAAATSQLTPEQCSQLQALAKARNDPAFGLLVNQLTTASKRPSQRFNVTA